MNGRAKKKKRKVKVIAVALTGVSKQARLSQSETNVSCGGSVSASTGFLVAIFRPSGSHGWMQVDGERDDVKCEDESDKPFKDGGNVTSMSGRGGGEDDDENKFDEKKGKLQAEGDAENRVLTVS